MGRRDGDRRRFPPAGERPGTIAIDLDERGQTTQDFAVGIGVFLLSVAFVFSFAPSLSAPYESSSGGAETAQADRIADTIVANLSEPDAPNRIATDEYFGDDSAELVSKLGLRSAGDGGDQVVVDGVNVRLETFEGETIDEHDEGGDSYDNQSAASSARIVTTETESDGCEPACRLVVRVW